MSVCGRCHGRLEIKAARGPEMIPCPDCEGGIKRRVTSLGARSVSVPLNGAKCVVCGEPAVHNHHVVSQQRIDRFVPENLRRRAKLDPRGVTPLCFFHHDLAESDGLHFEAHELHPEFPQFVIDYDLVAALPRYMTCGAAAQSSRAGTVGESGVVAPQGETRAA